MAAAGDDPDAGAVVDAQLARLDDLSRRVQGYLEAPDPDGRRHRDEAALQALHRVLFEESPLPQKTIKRVIELEEERDEPHVGVEVSAAAFAARR